MLVAIFCAQLVIIALLCWPFLKKNLPGIVISVDIGINLENAETILNAGADRLTVGSSIWKSGDPIGELESFQSLV